MWHVWLFYHTNIQWKKLWRDHLFCSTLWFLKELRPSNSEFGRKLSKIWRKNCSTQNLNLNSHEWFVILLSFRDPIEWHFTIFVIYLLIFKKKIDILLIDAYNFEHLFIHFFCSKGFSGKTHTRCIIRSEKLHLWTGVPAWKKEKKPGKWILFIEKIPTSSSLHSWAFYTLYRNPLYKFIPNNKKNTQPAKAFENW